MSASRSPSEAELVATEVDAVAGPSGPETSGPADSWGVCWNKEELGLRQVCYGGG